MEITTEIKEKMFAQHQGQVAEWQMPGYTHKVETEIIQFDGIDFLTSHNAKIRLKPLPDISKKDALEVSKIIGGASHLSEESQISQVRDLLCSPNIYVNVTNISGIKWLLAFQYLELKGYDLPQQLLDGKTLHECGLAVYESDKE